jgi:hypothetical protein
VPWEAEILVHAARPVMLSCYVASSVQRAEGILNRTLLVLQPGSVDAV